MQAEKVWPASVDAEEALLGCLLINPDDIWSVANKITQEDFFLRKNGNIYDAMMHLASNGHGIDNITVSEQLDKNDLLNSDVQAHMAHLLTVAPYGANIETYAEQVIETSVRRRLLDACNKAAKLAFDEKTPLSDVIPNITSRFSEASGHGVGDDILSGHDLATLHSEHVEALRQLDEPPGIKTGYSNLDKLIVGIQPGDFFVLGAGTGHGKTQMSINIALNAILQGHGIMVVSFEMRPEQMMNRVAALMSGISSRKFKSGDLTNDEMSRAYGAWDSISRMPLWITRPSIGGKTMSNIIANASRLQMQEKLDLVIIDYLQQVQPERAGNRTQEVGRIADAAKNMAMELGVGVLALSQLNRRGQRDDRPSLNDLRESGNMENNADGVWLLFNHDAAHGPDAEYPGIIELDVAKNRDGPTDTINLHINYINGKITEVNRVSDDYGNKIHLP
jgi:replicative DNA helicase